MTSLPIHPSQPPPPADEFDPANVQLADALRKSFRILKFIMMVLVVLYFLSGWFSVKPGEVGVVTRYGRVVGGVSAVLLEGWHWSWPYPIERWTTVPIGERELPVEFMFQLTDEEKTAGSIKGYRYDNLSPARDDYLITGDVNLLHASLVAKYRITDPVAYLTNVLPMPAARAGVRSEAYLRYPEYTLLGRIVRDAVIETAARREALGIRGSGQSEFLESIALCVSQRLKAMEKAGSPLGLSIDPANGIIAPKTKNVEGILPPRQTQEAFEGVDKAQAGKVVAITKAESDSQELLFRSAGPAYQGLAEAVDAEFSLIGRLSAAESKTGAGAEVEALRGELAAHRAKSEALLKTATGDVQNILKSAEIQRDRLVKEAAADHAQFLSLLPEYLKNPEGFMNRLASETYAQALDNARITKMFLPETGGSKVWLKIPRTPRVEAQDEAQRNEERPGVIKDTSGVVEMKAQ